MYKIYTYCVILPPKMTFKASRLAHSIPLFFELSIENESLVDRFMDITFQEITYKELLKLLIPRLPWYFLSHVFKKMGRWKIQK